jgi:hypothetical protein
MALWIKIVIRLGKLHHVNPGVSLNQEIKHLIRHFLSGSLIENDQIVAEKILDHIWGDESTLLMKRDSVSTVGNKPTNSQSNVGGLGEVSEDTIAKHLTNLQLSKKDVQVKKVQSLLYNIREGFSTILCAPTMTGKSVLLKVRNKRT